eukprot:TRINITY_DN39113_c0_g1_i1.p1 TRINITY_DN39113_c0_g1~~TRINITY_DN39113_c0_g1_i1.p1  ORF type:complete len:156 (+),score=47.55 TRINITY_DN39113_c0_g1_i1:90-557(+)
MIRRPPRSTLSSSSAASDVYKRQTHRKLQSPMVASRRRKQIDEEKAKMMKRAQRNGGVCTPSGDDSSSGSPTKTLQPFSLKPPIDDVLAVLDEETPPSTPRGGDMGGPVSYTHLRAHETPEHLVCRLLLEKKKNKKRKIIEGNQLTTMNEHQPDA